MLHGNGTELPVFERGLLPAGVMKECLTTSTRGRGVTSIYIARLLQFGLVSGIIPGFDTTET